MTIASRDKTVFEYRKNDRLIECFEQDAILLYHDTPGDRGEQIDAIFPFRQRFLHCDIGRSAD